MRGLSLTTDGLAPPGLEFRLWRHQTIGIVAYILSGLTPWDADRSGGRSHVADISACKTRRLDARFDAPFSHQPVRILLEAWQSHTFDCRA